MITLLVLVVDVVTKINEKTCIHRSTKEAWDVLW